MFSPLIKEDGDDDAYDEDNCQYGPHHPNKAFLLIHDWLGIEVCWNDRVGVWAGGIQDLRRKNQSISPDWEHKSQGFAFLIPVNFFLPCFADLPHVFAMEFSLANSKLIQSFQMSNFWPITIIQVSFFARKELIETFHIQTKD